MKVNLGDIICDTSVAQPPTPNNCWDTSTGAAPGAASQGSPVMGPLYTTPQGGTSYQLPGYSNNPASSSIGVAVVGAIAALALFLAMRGK